RRPRPRQHARRASLARRRRRLVKKGTEVIKCLVTSTREEVQGHLITSVPFFSLSVFRDGGVDFGPRVDATGDVVDPGEAELAEVFGCLCAAAAAVAQERQHGFLWQRLEGGGAVVEMLERARQRRDC